MAKTVVGTDAFNGQRVYFACVMTAGAKPTITRKPFGTTVDGKAVDIHRPTNSRGVEASILTYGGTVVTLRVPDNTGKLDDVILGYDSTGDYEKHTSFFGSLIGRYANRIGKRRFSLDGREFSLTTNNGENHLYGGVKGYDRVVWTARPYTTTSGASLELKHLSRDGEGGYPGAPNITVVYSWTEKNELKIVYSASSDKSTVVMLTHHSYFNLAGAGNPSILDHELSLNASKFTPTGAGSIPTGKLRSVRGTPFIFLKSTPMGASIGDAEEQQKFGQGYGHNWVLDKSGKGPVLAATVYEPTSRRVIQAWTIEQYTQTTIYQFSVR